MLVELQFGRWGFRINGGALHSYATREEAKSALWHLLIGQYQ